MSTDEPACVRLLAIAQEYDGHLDQAELNTLTSVAGAAELSDNPDVRLAGIDLDLAQAAAKKNLGALPNASEHAVAAALTKLGSVCR